MIHWFKRHPQHLLVESAALSKDANYKQLYQVRDNLFISHGYILVRLEKTYRFPVLIVYPEATPYMLPSIYPLTGELSKEQVELIAKGTVGQVFSTVSSYIKYYYHLRHQNKGGALCILEWDNLDDGSKFYGISSILKRVRDWFKGTITGEFPIDSQEVEFHAHFVNLTDGLKLLYPDKFLEERVVEGESYSLLLSYWPTLNNQGFERRTYFGCLLTGKAKSGLIEQIEYDLPNFFLDEGIRSPIELIEKVGVLTRLVAEKRLLRSSWFQLVKEPKPFENFTELILLIGEGDYDAGVKRMLPYFTEEQKEKPQHFFISVRFPNRKGQQEFQLFKILKKTELTGALILVSAEPPDEVFNHIINSNF